VHEGRLDVALSESSVLYWLAGSSRPGTADHLGVSIAPDVVELQRLLEQLAGLRRRPRLVLASSGGTVYDRTFPAPYSEGAPTRPVSRYGQIMLEMESLVEGFASRTLRISNAYGPGQRPVKSQGVIAHWLTAALDRRPIRVYGSDRIARDYVFVDDVVDALVLAGGASAPPGVFNIGSGRPTPLAELIEAVAVAVHPSVVEIERLPARSFDGPSTWLDVRRAASVLGWSPRTRLADGIEATWRWTLDQPDRVGSGRPAANVSRI
jgi:UDP-glucose 4-epimerase